MLGGLPGLPHLPDFGLEDLGQLIYLLKHLVNSLHPFTPSGQWGQGYGGFGDHHPKSCIKPPELGFKVFRYSPDAGILIDLNDGIGDPGRGNGDPSHFYPWLQDEHNGALYVGVLNGNPNPLNPLPAVLSLFGDDPFTPTLHTSGPEIWRWVNGKVWDFSDGETASA